MSEFAVAVLRIAFLAAIWMFILMAAGVIRTDIFGERVDAGSSRRGLRRRRRDEPVAEVPAGPALPTELVITEGRSQGTRRELRGVMGIGRAAGSAVLIDDDYSSSRHAQLVPAGDGSWIVEDLNSTNGTYVNGTRITQPTRVGTGDTIRIGRTQLRLES
ncbi:antibiotic biosynthesis regulator FhaB [Luteococcus peritonei]